MDQTTFCLLMGPALPVIVVPNKASWKRQLEMGAEQKKVNHVTTMNGLSKMSLVYI